MENLSKKLESLSVDLAKNAIKVASDFRHHRRQNAEARRALAIIESQRGKLNPALRARADAYANDVLGWIGFAPWLYVYSAVAGAFREGWIPDNYYQRLVIPAIQGSYGEVSFLKPMSQRLFNDAVFPDAAYFVNGLFCTAEMAHIEESDLKSVLFAESSKVVFKTDYSARGSGVSVYDPHTFDIELIKKEGNGVFQKYIDQHDFFSTFSPSSVATLRITTAVDDDGISSLRAVYLRLGRECDTHVQSSSAIRIPIDPANGALEEVGYYPSWETTKWHPDSHVTFAGMRIPSFTSCIDTVLELQRRMPYVRCVGWDVVVDRNNNVRVMEWNGYYNDVKFSEATQGPCFGDLGWEKLSARRRRIG